MNNQMKAKQLKGSHLLLGKRNERLNATEQKNFGYDYDRILRFDRNESYKDKHTKHTTVKGKVIQLLTRSDCGYTYLLDH